ncbi:hypothetical protein ABT063_28605 [Streptomyces sp. NPDC002838]
MIFPRTAVMLTEQYTAPVPGEDRKHVITETPAPEAAAGGTTHREGGEPV